MESPRSVLIIIGMHRSGTSALTAAFRACGATVGSQLLEPIEGVNTEGFWEDREVVELNERLIKSCGRNWYSVNAEDEVNWGDSRFDLYHSDAQRILKRGFGKGPVEVVKDPRFCFTLPLWKKAAEELEINVSFCGVIRPEQEVSLSLKKRDGFPLLFGKAIWTNYLKLMRKNCPEDMPVIIYQKLISDSVKVLHSLIEKLQLPLNVDHDELKNTVKSDLKHQSLSGFRVQSERGDAPLFEALSGNTRGWGFLNGWEQAGESGWEEISYDLSDRLVELNVELTRIGEMHGKALSVIDDRDNQLDVLNQKLNEIGVTNAHAMSVVEKRDSQLVEKNAQLEEKDKEICRLAAKISEIYSLPLLGRIVRKIVT